MPHQCIADRLFLTDIHTAAAEYALSVFHTSLSDHKVHIESHRAVFLSSSCNQHIGLDPSICEAPAS